jgi:hypothetical protein
MTARSEFLLGCHGKAKINGISVDAFTVQDGRTRKNGKI